MHFSLKHVLAALTVVALYCGVLAQLPVEHRVTAVLWTAPAAAVVYAIPVCFQDTPLCGAAFGFVLGAAVYFALAFAVPDIIPPFQSRAGGRSWFGARIPRVGWHDVLRPANALGVVFAGALGAAPGAIAFQTGRRDH
jgi:hypothetical protein